MTLETGPFKLLLGSNCPIHMAKSTQQTLTPVSQQNLSTEATPMVSVIVIAYNHAPYLSRCLNSILSQQTNFPIEIMIHDDASTDSTAGIIKAYAKQFPKIVKGMLQKKNQYSQQIKARPQLVGLSKGKYVAHCDGDDFWLDSHKLHKQVSFLEENPQFALSYHNALWIDSGDRITKKQALPEKNCKDYTKKELRIMQWGWILMGSIVHRNVLINFPKEYHLMPNGDNFYPMLLAEHGGAKYQGEVEPLAYLKHAGGMWSLKSRTEKERMMLQTYLQIVSYYVRTGDIDSAKILAETRLNKFVANVFNLSLISEGIDSDRN